MNSSKIPVVVILGPTAVGKTDVAISLAERFNGEIVSADSRLMYRGMDIGTAKPTTAQRTRVPHHLVDVADPDQTWSLAVFQRAAWEAISDINSRGRLAFLVGGTGQYLQAVMEGWSPPELVPNPQLRHALEVLADDRGPSWLHARLQTVDPLAAAKIDARNTRRTVRAWEVILLTGRRFSDQRKQVDSPYLLFKVGLSLPREELYGRIDQRIELMFSSGLLDEVKGLLEKGYSPELPSMSAIGYRECAMVLGGDLTIEEAKARMKRLTRIFVRRQANWFKPGDPTIHWYDLSRASFEQIPEAVQTFITQASHRVGDL